MMSKSMAAALNRQTNAEIYSAYLYLSMAAYFESLKLRGFGNWMRAQAQEELTHAMRIFDYIEEQGERCIMTAIDAPQTRWDSPPAAFEFVLAHEKKVTGLINGLVAAAAAEKDGTTGEFLQWFVKEQVEEEASSGAVVRKVNAAASDSERLARLDHELGRRVFHMPAPETRGGAE
jgi:ferritin